MDDDSSDALLARELNTEHTETLLLCQHAGTPVYCPHRVFYTANVACAGAFTLSFTNQARSETGEKEQ